MEIPSCGYVGVKFVGEHKPLDRPNTLRATPNLLENDHLRIEINNLGELVSIFDKDGNRELAAGPCNSFKMYKDIPGQWEAWDVDSTYIQSPVPLPEKARVEVLAAGPLLAGCESPARLTARRSSRRSACAAAAAAWIS